MQNRQTYDDVFLMREGDIGKKRREQYFRTREAVPFVYQATEHTEYGEHFAVFSPEMLERAAYVLSDDAVKNIVVVHSFLEVVRRNSSRKYTSVAEAVIQRGHLVVYDDQDEETWVAHTYCTYNEYVAEVYRAVCAKYAKIDARKLVLVTCSGDVGTSFLEYSSKFSWGRKYKYIFSSAGDNADVEYDEYITEQEGLDEIARGDSVRGKIMIDAADANTGCVIFVERGSARRVFVDSKKALNRAIDGDIVVCRLTEHADVAHGVVVRIVSRETKMISCTVSELDIEYGEKNNTVMLRPIDRRYPDIVSSTEDGAELLGERLGVIVTDWPRTSARPVGFVIERIGKIGETSVENLAVLKMNGLVCIPFSKRVLDSVADACEPDLSALPAWRSDMRGLCIVSIDPPECTDIDDALHCRRLENGNTEVGIHIADVSEFVREGSEVDIAAKHRATTLYMIGERFEMLPSVLSGNLCSLLENCDRLAFSCIVTFDSEFNTVDTRFTKSVVRSRKKFSYREAQEILDGTRECLPEIRETLFGLQEVALHMQRENRARGAIAFSRTHESVYVCDGVLCREDRQHYYAMEIVENLMILANAAAAKLIYESAECAPLLRRHPKPLLENFYEIRKKVFGEEITTESNIKQELNNVLGKAKSPQYRDLLNTMITQSMPQAHYINARKHSYEECAHFGLSIPLYTHFTSPIRRYADIIVHRQIGRIVRNAPQTDAITDDVTIRRLNRIAHASKRAMRMATQYFATIIEWDSIDGTDGFVTRVVPGRMHVFVSSLQTEGIVELEHAADSSAPCKMFEHVVVRPAISLEEYKRTWTLVLTLVS